VYDEPQDGPEHRRYPRVDCGGVADLRVLPSGGKETGTLVNLSKRGCCFLADDDLIGSPGSHVEVHLKVRGIDFRVHGVIRHIRQWRKAGIEFIQLNERKCEQIEELMAELDELCKAADRARNAACKLREQEYLSGPR
jgi:hypothetical protein